MLSEAEAMRERDRETERKTERRGRRGGSKEVKNKKKIQNGFAERDRGSRSTQFRLSRYTSMDELIQWALSIPYVHSKNTITDTTVRNKLPFSSYAL